MIKNIENDLKKLWRSIVNFWKPIILILVLIGAGVGAYQGTHMSGVSPSTVPIGQGAYTYMIETTTLTNGTQIYYAISGAIGQIVNGWTSLNLTSTETNAVNAGNGTVVLNQLTWNSSIVIPVGVLVWSNYGGLTPTLWNNSGQISLVGATGAQGPQGIQGATGATGASGSGTSALQPYTYMLTVNGSNYQVQNGTAGGSLVSAWTSATCKTSLDDALAAMTAGQVLEFGIGTFPSHADVFPSGITIEGASEFGSIYQINSAGYGLMSSATPNAQTDPLQNNLLLDFSINCNGYNAGIYVDMENCTLSYLCVYGSSGSDVLAVNGGAYDVYGWNILECSFQDAGKACLEVNQVTDSRISFCNINSAGDDAILLENQSSKWDISQSIFGETSNYAIEINGYSNLGTISQCEIAGGDQGELMINGSGDWTVHSNYFLSETNYGAVNASSSCIIAFNGYMNTFSQNHFYSSTSKWNYLYYEEQTATPWVYQNQLINNEVVPTYFNNYLNIVGSSDTIQGNYPIPDSTPNSITAPVIISNEYLLTFGGVNAGPAINATVKQTVTAGQLIFVNATGFFLSSATTSATMPVIGIAWTGAAANNIATIGTFGPLAYNSGWSWTPGSYIYAGTTAGSLTATYPSATGNIDQAIGIALSATIIELYNPSTIAHS